MRYRDIIEATNHSTMEVYHWTSAENLIKILRDDQIDVGAATHQINGHTVSGVSLTRNAFFDMSKTYAISGRKAWRIGLDYRKLRHRYKVVPIRDDYLQVFPRGTNPASDEMEEFVLSDITNLTSFVTSIGVDHECIDPMTHPWEMANDPDYFEEDFGIESMDQQVFFSLAREAYPELYAEIVEKAKHKKMHGWRPYMLEYPEHARFYIIDRNYHRSIPVREIYDRIIGPETE